MYKYYISNEPYFCEFQPQSIGVLIQERKAAGHHACGYSCDSASPTHAWLCTRGSLVLNEAQKRGIDGCRSEEQRAARCSLLMVDGQPVQPEFRAVVPRRFGTPPKWIPAKGTAVRMGAGCQAGGSRCRLHATQRPSCKVPSTCRHAVDIMPRDNQRGSANHTLRTAPPPVGQLIRCQSTRAVKQTHLHAPPGSPWMGMGSSCLWEVSRSPTPPPTTT